MPTAPQSPPSRHGVAVHTPPSKCQTPAWLRGDAAHTSSEDRATRRPIPAPVPSANAGAPRLSIVRVGGRSSVAIVVAGAGWVATGSSWLSGPATSMTSRVAAPPTISTMIRAVANTNAALGRCFFDGPALPLPAGRFVVAMSLVRCSTEEVIHARSDSKIGSNSGTGLDPLTYSSTSSCRVMGFPLSPSSGESGRGRGQLGATEVGGKSPRDRVQPLVDRMCRCPEHRPDFGVRQSFPACES